RPNATSGSLKDKSGSTKDKPGWTREGAGSRHARRRLSRKANGLRNNTAGWSTNNENSPPNSSRFLLYAAGSSAIKAPSISKTSPISREVKGEGLELGKHVVALSFRLPCVQ